MKYATVCSGIEAPSVAWETLGWEPQFFSEIEKFPCRLLKTKYPNVSNFGDMVNYQDWPHKDIDVMIAGSPCQSYSIAGQRKGLNDERGNLALTYLNIVGKYKPRWFIWENVPGVLSSNKGQDFRQFLRKVDEIGYCGAWRILDAQYIRTQCFPRAVPQRRRRLFFVGHIGDWRCSAKVLFDNESVYGSTPPSRQAGKEVAGTPAHGLEKSSTQDQPNLACEDYVQTMRRLGHGDYVSDNKASTVLAGCSSADKTDLIVSLEHSKSNGSGISEKGVSYTLSTSASQAVLDDLRVRKLTPLECERLMGFPDGYTDIEGASDSVRYKALGNSMCVNVIEFLGRKIEEVNYK